MNDEREKQGQPQGFTVSDRRKRYEEPGEPAVSAKPEPAAEPAVKPPAEPAAGLRDEHAVDETAHDAAGEGAGAPGPADFLQLIGKLYQEGLAFMGVFDDPKTGQSMANFPVASWHIDILGVLEEKTRGNLGPDEAQMLKEAIANLKVTYVRTSGFIKH